MKQKTNPRREINPSVFFKPKRKTKQNNIYSVISTEAILSEISSKTSTENSTLDLFWN